MSGKQPTNLAASVRQRLLNIAKARGEELQLVLTRYGVERLLYRLGRVPAGERFVLKGAVLFTLWEGAPHRPTRDVDFLGWGDPSPDAVANFFRAVCDAEVEADGLTFLAESVEAEPIRDRQEYGGVRLTMLATLGGARVPLQADVGFGDAVTPAPEMATFPTLLPDFPAPRVRAYPAEAVVAEKFQAMAALGIANTRMKDFYDVWVLSETRAFDAQTLGEAIRATFARRGTALPGEPPPLALTPTFGRDAEKQAQWRAFLARARLRDAPDDLATVVERVGALVLPLLTGAPDSERRATWTPGADWTLSDD